MKKCTPLTLQAAALALLFTLAGFARAETPIKDVLAHVDPATGKAKDAGSEFSVNGIVAARLTLPDHNVLAFVHNPGEPALAVLADPKEAAAFIPRNVVTLAGKLTDTPVGAALLVKAGSVSVTETNKPFTSVSVAGALFKDASALAGRYVQLTNVTFGTAKFDASGAAKVRCPDGTEVTLLISPALADREPPAGANDVFGVVARTDSGWRLIAARFLPINRKECQDLATKRTCLTCHNPDTKVVGPAYRDVAAKYRNDPEAIPTFISQMETGGTGKWGTNVMVPLKAVVPPEDMKILATWVFSYRWDALLAE